MNGPHGSREFIKCFAKKHLLDSRVSPRTYLGRRTGKAVLFTGWLDRASIACCKARPAQLNLHQPEKGGVIVKMKFSIASLYSVFLNGKRQSCATQPGLDVIVALKGFQAAVRIILAMQ